MTQQFDPGISQAALLQIAEATLSAAVAAKAASAAATAAGTSQSSSGSGAQPGAKHVDWPKLLNKTLTLTLGEGKTVEDDVKGWRDYQWQLQQYFVAIDDGHESELRQLTGTPNGALDMSSADAEIRNRSNKLYSLLASLMKSRCLAIVKSVQFHKHTHKDQGSQCLLYTTTYLD